MRKLLLPAALLAATSLGFYLKGAAAVKDTPATQYMTVISQSRLVGISGTATEIVSIDATGAPKIKDVDTRNVHASNTAGVLLRRAEMLYLNELAAEGWHIIQITQTGNTQSPQHETSYFLERRASN